MTPPGSPRLARITIFPVKSLDGLEVSETRVIGGGGLAHDREYRLVDADGRALNVKRMGEKLLAIRAVFDLAFGELELRLGDDRIAAQLPRGAGEIARWLAAKLGQPVGLERDALHGFPDDDVASGPTVVSRATLSEVSGWFGFDEAEARRRFRANLEIDGVPAFWEDCLYGAEGERRRFQVGHVFFEGVNPCARCTAPSRDSRSGEMHEPAFAKLFAQRREQSLPAWAEASGFGHFYRLAANTVTPPSENGKTLQLGDEVRLL